MTCHGQLWVIKPDGTDRIHLTHAPSSPTDDDPAWSPAGQEILFSTNRNGSRAFRPLTADGSDQRRLASSAARCPEMPHGTRLGKALR
jgi:Tol biopolymer transport system component